MKKLWLALPVLGLLALAPALAQVVQTVPIAPGPQLIPKTGSQTGTTGAISASIPGVAGKFTYVCGFTITSAGTTTSTSVTATLSNVANVGVMSFVYVFPNSGQGILGVAFPGCITSNAISATVSINVPAGGTGTTAATNIWGYNN